MCRMELIPWPGIYTPIIPVGMAVRQLIMEAAPTKHPASMLENFPTIETVRFSVAPAKTSLDGSFAWIRLASGHRSHFVHLVARSLEESVKSKSPPIGRLKLITAIHHVRHSLPPHVCFDRFLPSTVTVKDEGPCGPSRHCAMETSGTVSGLGKSELSRAWSRFRLLANCRLKSVTLGDGGIKACWLVFTRGAKLTLSCP